MKQLNSFIPKKSLGQNFLINSNIAERIISACNIKPTDVVLEIGPGKGALTCGLSQQSKHVYAIEKDKELAERLKHDLKNTNVTVINADILKYSFHKLPQEINVIGNLPYNIATPIIKKIIDHKDKLSKAHITVQLEYGQRIVAKPNSKSYGALSCYVQYYADVKLLFKMRNSAFQPIPKVQSCFLCLDFLKKREHQAKSEDLLFRIIHSCFGQRRKTIGNSLAGALAKEKIQPLLQTLQINPKLRAENLSLEEYIRMANTAMEMI